MKWKTGCILIVMLIGQAACNSTAVPESSTPLEPTSPPVSITEEVPMETAVSSPPSTTESDGQTGVVTPVTVNLWELTPSPAADSSPVVQPAPGVPDAMVALVHQMKMDLAGRLNIDISEIQEGVAEEVVWPDSSLGCPTSGPVLDVLVPGFRVILHAQGQTYEYHSQDTSRFVWCQP